MTICRVKNKADFRKQQLNYSLFSTKFGPINEKSASLFSFIKKNEAWTATAVAICPHHNFQLFLTELADALSCHKIYFELESSRLNDVSVQFIDKIKFMSRDSGRTVLRKQILNGVFGFSALCKEAAYNVGFF